MNPYMRAHGELPGPTQRPLLTGAITGAVALIAAAPVIWAVGAAKPLAHALGILPWMALLMQLLVMAAGAVLYARIFQRSANDRRGGWLFGISFGFLLWMLGPVTFLQWILRRPLLSGYAAMGLFAAFLFYGLALGAGYPVVHVLTRGRLK